MTSAWSARRRRMSWPFGLDRSSVIDFLPRLSTAHQRETPLSNGGIVRMKSPVPGCSTLMTSAPSSARSVAANGAPIRVPRSSTRIPVSAPVMRASELAIAVLEDLLHRRLPLPLGQHVERGLGVVLELVDHEVVLERGPVAG